MASYIPEDIMFFILKLLPAKDLLRLKSVCKGWKKLIDCPSFIQCHLALQKRRFLLQCNPVSFMVSDLVTCAHPLSGPNCTRLLSTQHGIVSLYHHDKKPLIYLWNPTLRRISSLPSPPSFQHSQLEGHGTTYSAFWINPLTKQFRIVLFKLMHPHDPVGAIFSSVEGSWAQLALEGLSQLRPLQERPPVLIQGVAHWAVKRDILNNGITAAIISYDFEAGNFEVLEGNPVGIRWEIQCACSSVQGSLLLLYLDNTDLCDIFFRQDGRWVNLFTLELASDIRAVHWVTGEVEDGYVGKSGKRKNRVFAASDERLFSFRTDGRRVVVKAKLLEANRCLVSDGYVESLLFPDICECGSKPEEEKSFSEELVMAEEKKSF